MTTATGLDFLVTLADLIIILSAVGMLIYGAYHWDPNSDQPLPISGIFIGLGLIVAVIGHSHKLAAPFIDPVALDSDFGLAAPTIWGDWFFGASSHAAFALIGIGFVLAVLHRRRSEDDLQSNKLEMKALRGSGRDADQRFRYLFNNTSNSVYCFEFNPPMPISLSTEQQIELSHSATLSQCNTVFARVLEAKSPVDVIGLSYGSLDGAKDTLVHNAFFKAFIENDYRLNSYLLNYETPDGMRRAFEVNMVGVVENGLLERIWAIESDQSELVETKESLKRRQDFQQLVADVSARLVKALDAEADAVVEELLKIL